MSEPLEQITTHADDAAARLSGQWASSPLLLGLVRGAVDGVQEDENCLATLRAWYRSIAAAQGTTLDAIG
ncbi:hypothetical protein LRR18_17820, partial [Mangrovimonas sp. AS39]|uniref:hypothetical protein n=1 Tax=Mangrovimonas futianensis TaxID=2895523 RepID=UPI001E3E9A52